MVVFAITQFSEIILLYSDLPQEFILKRQQHFVFFELALVTNYIAHQIALHTRKMRLLI